MKISRICLSLRGLFVVLPKTLGRDVSACGDYSELTNFCFEEVCIWINEVEILKLRFAICYLGTLKAYSEGEKRRSANIRIASIVECLYHIRRCGEMFNVALGE